MGSSSQKTNGYDEELKLLMSLISSKIEITVVIFILGIENIGDSLLIEARIELVV